MAAETVSQAQTLQVKASPRTGVWIEVDLGSILRNLEQIQLKTRPFTRVMAVVKSNAYGHGLVPVSRALEGKVDFLGLGSLREATFLREQGITTPLFLFGRLFSDELPVAIQVKLTLTVSSLEEAKDISEAARQLGKKGKVLLHIKVDTGMGRFGMPYAGAFEVIGKMAALPHLMLEGIYTHFPVAEAFPDSYGLRQLARFEKLIEDLRRIGLTFRYRHAANTAGALRIKSHQLNLIRPGIGLYGIYPHPSFQGEIELAPALSLKTRIAFIKRLQAGDSAGYGRGFIAQNATTVAILPVGYAHGYPYQASGRSEVLHRGKRLRVVGRVCMDSMMVDLGPAPEATAGDEVTLLGSSGGETVRAEDLARLAASIPYQIVTCLDTSLPRIYR